MRVSEDQSRLRIRRNERQSLSPLNERVGDGGRREAEGATGQSADVPGVATEIEVRFLYVRLRM